MAKTKKAPAPSTAAKPRGDMNGWVLCPGDGVLIISPGEEYHGLFAKVDAFPTTLELSSYVQIDGRPTTVGRVLVPNAHLRWSGPGLDQLDEMRPTRPGQRVRVVLDNESLATAEMKALDGQLGEVTELGPLSSNNVSMITVKFDDPALLPASVYNYDLVIVPTPVVEYVPEPEAQPAPAAKQKLTLDHFAGMVDTAAAGLRVVPLASIVVTTNTRKVFDETALAELAESVRAHGILQPIVLRPHGTESGKYELVAGGRRYRAAQLAELAEVPATVRNLTDREFLEVQLLENLQRVDVRPADEATAFAQLLKSGFPSEEIAQKVGKPVKFVLQRAKLASLMPFWLDALEEGRLPIVAANEIARLPDESQAHLESVAMKDYNYKQPGAVFSAGWIKGAISQHVLRELNAAAFPKHDAQLCPAAGACTTCPKRSGAFKQLFDEQELKHDYCLDGTCFETKKAAFVTRRQKELSKEQGKPVVRLASNGWNVPPGAVSSYSWSEVAADKPGAVQALVIDGAEAGQTKWVSLPTEKEKSAEKKADRSAEIRKEKIGEQHRQLLAAHLYTQSLHSNRVSEVHLDNQIYGELRSQGGPHTPLRLALVTYFGWEMPEGGEKALRKLTPASDYQGVRTWEQQNVARLSYDEKLALYFALLGYQCSTFDSSNERLIKYAKSVGAPVEGLKKRATEVVDAPKVTSKKQEATA